MADETHTTIIAADAQFKGEISFEGNCRILGRLEGSITTPGELHIAEGAVAKAEVDAGRVIVDGTVDGNITAKDTVELTAKAVITGDIVATKLSVAEGATITGHLSIGAKGAAAAADTPPAAPAGDEALDKPASADRPGARQPAKAR